MGTRMGEKESFLPHEWTREAVILCGAVKERDINVWLAVINSVMS